jgi:peptidoglycan DL-endopeptidase CwlO
VAPVLTRYAASKLTRYMRKPLVAITATLTLAAFTPALNPLVAGGATIEGKQAEAAQLEQQIQDNGDKIAALGEMYNGAVLEYQNAQAAVAEAKRRLATAEAEQSKLSSLVAERGAALYLGAQNPTAMIPDSNIKSLNELGARTMYGAVATGNDQQLIANLTRAKQDLSIERKQFDKQVKAAAGKRDFISSTQQQVEEANSREQSLLSQVQGEIATLIAEKKAREAAALRASLLAIANASSSGGGGGSRVPSSSVGGDAIPNLPAPSARAAAAIGYAEAQLGKPYVYAASGPNTFDCSGLTMMAWAAAGVSMPHYSGAQYGMFPHVPLDELEPGDLIFWGSGGSEHVSMYIGGGLQIAATHTGDYVRIQPIGRNPVGAARPG